jgi:hypothetical protein
MKVLVTLSIDELRIAASAGVERNLRAMVKNRRPNQPERPDWEQQWWQSNVNGCIGELAVCKAFGVEFTDTVEDIDGDVLGYQVRTIQNPKAGLRVRSHDRNEDTFILAQVHKAQVLLHGYMTGWQVKQRGLEEFPRCFTMPARELYSVTDLPHEIQWADTVKPYGLKQAG